MELTQAQFYAVPALVAGFFAWRLLRFRAAKKGVPALLGEGAVIVDVRSRGEFAVAGNPVSINIPLDELERRSDELDPSKPVVLCCASGTRSAMAAALLRRKGFRKVSNAGPWHNTVVG
jgi:rhodanese-related sulfurtransferase